MKMKRSFIVISILLFLTFSISIISSFLSYSSIKLVNEDTDTKTSIYTANLYVTYDNNKQIAINSNAAIPLTKTITIENASDRELKYKLELISVANILDTISYSISKNDEVIKTDNLPNTDTNLLEDIAIGPNSTDKYIITFNNNTNLGGLYTATLKVEANV